MSNSSPGAGYMSYIDLVVICFIYHAENIENDVEIFSVFVASYYTNARFFYYCIVLFLKCLLYSLLISYIGSTCSIVVGVTFANLRPKGRNM
jgi:fucose 4-O-acetylase-like acetyltransferase